VVDGVWAVPVPLHGSPLRSIVVYLLESSEGLILIDAGYEHASCWDSFCDSLATLGHGLASIRLVLLTHNHPDHVGFADRVREASGARVAMGRADDFSHQADERGGFLTQLRNALDLTGAPAEVTATMYAEALKVAHHAESLELDLVLTEDTDLTLGDVTIRAVHAPGHTYGHTVYVDSRGLVFTGDTMMAEGPTQLAIPSLPTDNPAADLLATLDRIPGLGAEIACPAHQFAYRDVAARAEELKGFHQAEVDAVRLLLDQHSTAWEIAPHLTWAKPWDELGTGTRRFALIHTLALMRGAARAGQPSG
jgi:glyoxylase-like metal-dependent hydrolase (beta-lactamase superfamily II)